MASESKSEKKETERQDRWRTVKSLQPQHEIAQKTKLLRKRVRKQGAVANLASSGPVNAALPVIKVQVYGIRRHRMFPDNG